MERVRSILERSDEMSKLDNLIQEMCPNGVESKRVDEIADINIGLATSVTKYKRPEGVLLLHNSDIQQNRIVLKTMEYISEEFANKNAGKILRENDIITVHTGDVGTSAVVSGEFVGAIGFTTITTRIKDFNEIYPYYLSTFFNSQKCKREIARMTISDRSNLNQKDFVKLMIPVPPLEVQREIVHILDSSISLFGDKDAGGIVLLNSFKDYYYGYQSVDGKDMPGYVDLMEDLTEKWKRKREQGESTDIIDDIVFEVELIKQIEINIDYILMLVKKYHDNHQEDKEVLITINKAIDASPELRSKKALIETFIAGINDVDDVMAEWHDYVIGMREEDLKAIIAEEHLKPEETRKFIENAFRDGEIKTEGTDIEKILSPVSRFGGGRDKKKQGVIEKLKAFFEKYFGVGGSAGFFSVPSSAPGGWCGL